MARWRCPECAREFGRAGQMHSCSPALSGEAYFATAAPHERPVFEAVRDHFEGVGDVYIEFVTVGVFFKRRRVFLQLRPLRRRVAISLMLPRRLDDARITRKVIAVGQSYVHVINVAAAEEVDETLRGWMDEAYLSDV